MRETPLRVAVIGCGFYAQNHLNAWRYLAGEGVALTGVCDLDPSRAQAAAARFGARAFTDAQAMITELRPDLLDIVTQVDTHLPLVALAARNGIAAVVQKPLARDWAECLALARQVIDAAIPFGVHENFRFQAPILRLRRLLASNIIGRATFARISFRTSYDVFRAQPYLAREPRLVILDVGIHLLDLARVLMGKVQRVHCEVQHRKPDIVGEDTATMLLRHENGGVSVVDCSFAARRAPDVFPETLIEIEGDNGFLRLGPGGVIDIIADGQPCCEAAATPLLPWTEQPWHVTQESVLTLNRHILNRWRQGLPPETDLADNLATFALVEAAYAAALSGRAEAPMQWKEDAA